MRACSRVTVWCSTDTGSVAQQVHTDQTSLHITPTFIPHFILAKFSPQILPLTDTRDNLEWPINLPTHTSLRSVKKLSNPIRRAPEHGHCGLAVHPSAPLWSGPFIMYRDWRSWCFYLEKRWSQEPKNVEWRWVATEPSQKRFFFKGSEILRYKIYCMVGGWRKVEAINLLHSIGNCTRYFF